ncbi:MAG TPA: MaoC/PaaZ C-terminal domain-containing protein [Micromonosporaceae bacterium]|nr:MaoC/PaaZ C-terminal domain-containing protein [Micromonosporaceae bacterium]
MAANDTESALVTEIAKAPRATTIYRRAIRSSLRRRPDEATGTGLPATELVLRGVDITLDRVAAYNRVCGFRLSDALPVTYPHVLAFPLAMQVMSEPGFPLPVVGLIHVANRVTQARTIHLDERLDLTVRAAALRPHERGLQFDVGATATIDGREVWHGISTYLRRAPTDGAPTASGVDDSALNVACATDSVATGADQPPPTGLWHVAADTGRAYAAVSGDHNPIHVSRVGARAFGFRHPIAHGMWTMARAVAALEGRLGETYTVDVSFVRPILLPSTVAWRARRDDGGWTIAVTDPDSNRPRLTGSIAPA